VDVAPPERVALARDEGSDLAVRDQIAYVSAVYRLSSTATTVTTSTTKRA